MALHKDKVTIAQWGTSDIEFRLNLPKNPNTMTNST
jgi:hypothetical protein